MLRYSEIEPKKRIYAGEASSQYRPVWKLIKKEFPELTEEQQLKILNIALKLCNGCHESWLPCWCQNDE